MVLFVESVEVVCVQEAVGDVEEQVVEEGAQYKGLESVGPRRNWYLEGTALW